MKLSVKVLYRQILKGLICDIKIYNCYGKGLKSIGELEIKVSYLYQTKQKDSKKICLIPIEILGGVNNFVYSHSLR